MGAIIQFWKLMEDERAVTYVRGLNGRGQARSSAVGEKLKLLDQLRGALRSRHYSRRTEIINIYKNKYIK